MPRIERALLSVTDKTGIVEFAKRLHAMGVELVSTGGTASILREQNIPVQEVADITEFPEMLDGRVKTIHPRIAGGILAIRSNPAHMKSLEEHGIPPIQMVVVNLYQFERYASQSGISREQLIEHVDIGGPTMIRAAAKNFQDVAVIVSPGQYESVLKEMEEFAGALGPATHWKLAQQAFLHTADYDSSVSKRLLEIDASGVTTPHALPSRLQFSVEQAAILRYGENPHQEAALYKQGNVGIAGAEQLHGKELSYNNLVDLDAAWQLVQEFEAPAAAIIKHTNPCGCAEQVTQLEAYLKAYEADPVSAFGGVLAFNRELEADTADEVAKLFVEAIVAPSFSESALQTLTKKKNLRLVKASPAVTSELVIKSISGGFLAQTQDHSPLDVADLLVRTKKQPSAIEKEALLFAWKVCKHVKSNAIVYARPGQIVSIGAGQMSRVDSVKVGAMKAVLPLKGTVLASDAFFPFPDGVEEAAKHGIAAVIQPGGSVRDEEAIAAADRLNLSMVFTGVRHFRH
jgi:phosphoribosylaminoimidazolecarboxamide formyltransferase / IMP cyclohydrolase